MQQTSESKQETFTITIIQTEVHFQKAETATGCATWSYDVGDWGYTDFVLQVGYEDQQSIFALADALIWGGEVNTTLISDIEAITISQYLHEPGLSLAFDTVRELSIADDLYQKNDLLTMKLDPKSRFVASHNATNCVETLG